MPKFAVIGLGRFGYKLAVTLTKEGGEVIAIDSSPEPVDTIKDDVAVALCLDATDQEALRLQGIDKVDTAVVCIGERFEACVLATALLKQMGVPRVYSRVSEGLHSRILELVGADRIIHPEEDMALKVGHSLMVKNIVDIIPISPEYNVAEIKAPQAFWGKSIGVLHLRRKYRVNLIVIKQEDESGEKAIIDSLPGAESIIEKGHGLIIVGKEKDIEAVARLE
jgi:trk system potassium uptake protein TrkA